MKEKLISRLVMGALVGLAATGAYAGQIQSSSTSVAREVIVADAQAVTSPRISYRFAGDVDARSQTQTFQVQFTLGGGAKWTSPLAANVDNVVVSDGVSGAVIPQRTVAAGHTAGSTDYSVSAMGLSADGTTLYATLTVYKESALNQGLIKQPLVTISGSATVANNPTVQNLYTVVGAVTACDHAVKTLPVSFKHYVALTSPGTLATDSDATPDEHMRGGATNSTTLISFPTNLNVLVTKAAGNAKLDVTTGNVSFAGTVTTDPGLVAIPAAPNAFYASSFVSAGTANLGTVSLVQQAQGYDAGVANGYLLSDATIPGVKQIATAAGQVGQVEVKQVDVKVSASQGAVVGSQLYLSKDADCSTALASTAAKTGVLTAANAAGPWTLTVDAQADFNNTFNAAKAPLAAGSGQAPVYVCYSLSGVVGSAAAASSVVPGSVFNVDAATIVKAAGTAPTYLNEQNNSCSGSLYPLSGSIKIDVRNYAQNARSDGWLSVLRLINTSESRTTTVWGQYINSDGKYGNWGKLTVLAPRAVLNMTPDQVNAALTNAPAHATAANNATAPQGGAGDAPRLRITSSDGNTLRVQNYLYNPASQNFIEASGSQGVDFTSAPDRAPVNEGQYTEQDAQAGLNGGN